MALFSTTSQMRDFLPVNLNFQFADIKPFVEAAERDILIPRLSQAQYDLLITNIASPAYADLLKVSRSIVAPAAMVAWLPFGQVQFSSAGIQIASNENMKTAFSWQIEDLKNSCNILVYSNIEAMQKYLLANKATFTGWATSDAFKKLFAHFINTATEFNEYFNIENSRFLFDQLLPTITRVENTAVKAVLCKDLYDEIKASILSENISNNNKVLLEYIKPAVANMAIAHSTGELLQRIERFSATLTAGIGKPSDQGNAQDERMGRLSMMRNQALNEAESQLKLLTEYLYANADTYPLWKNSPCYKAPLTEQEQTIEKLQSESGNIYFPG